jgi:hypothetical protein
MLCCKHHVAIFSNARKQHVTTYRKQHINNSNVENDMSQYFLKRSFARYYVSNMIKYHVTKFSNVTKPRY